MNGKAGDNEFWQQLEEKMKGYPDDEIIEILKKRKLYEPEAARLAIREAIERGLINSEQDLFSARFAPLEPAFTFFPCSNVTEVRRRVIKSLSRSLLLIGVIPVVYAFLKFNVAKYTEGGTLLASGILWMALTALLMLKEDKKLIAPMFLIVGIAMFYAGRMLAGLKGLKFIDWAIPGIVFLLVIYSLLYLRKNLTGPDKID